ncbi:uncharacterized protein [Macrobrachium rosenbergii]|uniref:uncharacterized protein n=1 Tax=Macrobrachium rosenbergii TaxID=79674 RepID=UPI0034D543ED
MGSPAMKLYSTVIIASVLSGLGRSVSIVNLSVPNVVEADTEPILLDCEYRVEEWESSGLVVKWYLDAVHLVYQWIPPIQPQALGVLSGLVNTSYRASKEPWEAFRALYIPHPQPELSGRYSCVVSTFEDEDMRSADLLVWAAARDVELKFWRPSEHLVNITCLAAAAAPEPSFALFTQNPNGTRYDLQLRGERKTNDSGLWWAEVWGLIAYDSTPEDTQIGCTITLPNTTYTTSLTKPYDPDLPIITTTTTTTQPTTTIGRDQYGRWGNMSMTTPGFFEISGLFGSANGGFAVAPDSSFTTAFLAFVIALWKMAAES